MTPCYFTTAQFAHRAQESHKHCGPTAITNLICSLHPALANDPGAVFDAVAAIGKKSGLYWNLARTKHIGGTNDCLAGLYLKRALAHFDIPATVRPGGLATPSRLRTALSSGAIVYLELHAHPRYHNHHLLLYGHDWQGFCAADGWRSAPVHLGARDLKIAFYFSVQSQDR